MFSVIPKDSQRCFGIIKDFRDHHGFLGILKDSYRVFSDTDDDVVNIMLMMILMIMILMIVPSYHH